MFVMHFEYIFDGTFLSPPLLFDVIYSFDVM